MHHGTHRAADARGAFHAQELAEPARAVTQWRADELTEHDAGTQGQRHGRGGEQLLHAVIEVLFDGEIEDGPEHGEAGQHRHDARGRGDQGGRLSADRDHGGEHTDEDSGDAGADDLTETGSAQPDEDHLGHPGNDPGGQR